MATNQVCFLVLDIGSSHMCLQPFVLEPLEGLHAFQLATEGPERKQAPAPASAASSSATAATTEWYCFTVAVAKQLRVTTRAVGQLFSRHLSAAEAATVLCLKRSSSSDQAAGAGAEFERVLSTYAAVKRHLDGAVDSLNSRKGDKLSLYPLPLVVKLMALHSPAKVSAQTLQAVREFLLKHQQSMAAIQLLALPLPGAGAGGSSGSRVAAGSMAMDLDHDKLASASPAGAGADSGSGSGSGSSSGLGLGLQPLPGCESMERKEDKSLEEGEIKVKLEPGLRSRRRRRQLLAVPVSSFLGGVPVIDLTDPATLADLDRLDDNDQADDAAADVEQTLSSLVDNFSLWHPLTEEYAVLREYGLRPDEVSVLLQEQCQRFSEYRQEIWNWNRDPNQVTPRTVGNNIRVFLLFGGFVCHSAKRHRLKPAAFDMSVFGSKHIEPYIMDFLQVTVFTSLS